MRLDAVLATPHQDGFPSVEFTNLGANNIMPDFRRIGAVALVAVFTIQLTPHRANAQAALVVVPVGAAIVVLGGIAYYTWINRQGQEELVPTSSAILEDPEEEIERMGQAQQVETVTAGTRSKAEQQCREIAAQRGLTLKEVAHFRDNQWNCVMY
jgi:Flp pilus assembly protein CpaB